MADRELRHMRRTELVEIIFALKQSEDQLKAENADLPNWNSGRSIWTVPGPLHRPLWN